jgi:competence protein ComEC
MNRLPILPIAAASYASGVVAGAILGGPWVLSFLLASAVVLVALAATRGATPTWWHMALGAAVVVLAVLGHVRIQAADAAPPPPLASMAGVHEVVGVVRDTPLPTGTAQRTDIDVETVDGAAFEGGIRGWFRADGGRLRAGDRVRFTGHLDRPPPIEAFDYAAFLRDRDIYLVASSVRAWEVLGRADLGWMGALRELHATVVDRIERAIPEPAASLSAGVLVGERSNMPPEVDHALRVTGTTHLVVISGQNVALLIGILVAVLTAFVSRRTASVIALLFLPAYVVFVSLDPPVVRAAIMAVAVVAAGVTGRRTPSWVYLVYAVAVMLAVEPRLVRDVAFQLSASATAGIITLAPALRDALLGRFPALGTPARTAALSVTTTAIGAALAVVPVQVGAFGVIVPWTIPANVVVAPLYEATVAVAALAALLGGTPAGDLLGPALALPPRAFLWIVETIASLPSTEIPLRLPLVAGIVFTGLLVAVTARLAGVARGVAEREDTPGLEPGAHTGIAVTTGLAVVTIGLWWAALTPGSEHPSIVVLDVGQGLAVLARDGDATLLIDTGPPDAAVMSALGRAGVARRIDAVALTHADADHAGGLSELMRRLDVGAVYVEAATVDAYDVAVLPLTIGDRITVGRIVAEVLAPPVATRDHRLASPNEASLVLMLTVGDRRVLVTGDIETAAEDWLVRTGLRLRADVLVVPHHGSRTSSSPAFVDAVAPAVAVIPVGRNSYGHPHEEVLARYAADPQIVVYRTDEHGSVTFRTDGDRLWLSTAR